MKKIAIYGAGVKGKQVYDIVKDDCSVVCFVDGNPSKIGTVWEGTAIDIVGKANLADYALDEIIVATLSSPYKVKEDLEQLGYGPKQINLSYVDRPLEARSNFVRDFSKICNQKGLHGCVAEAGVFQGDFSKVINECFPKSKLYLFDTFEGFANSDVSVEHKNGFSDSKVGDLSQTSEDLVRSRLLYPSVCEIRKGVFPVTAEGINDRFVFVNLDMDLYAPTKAGLEFFWNRMIPGGIIVVHDYFSTNYRGVKKAVDEWTLKGLIIPFPIGDGISIAVQRPEC